MTYYAVTLGTNVGIFTSRNDAISSIRNQPGGHYRMFHNKEEADTYMMGNRGLIEKKIHESTRKGERTLSIPTASIVTVSLRDEGYTVTITGPNGSTRKIVGRKERSTFLTSIMAISESMKIVEGRCIIVCTDSTLHTVYNNSSEWIGRRDGKYSELISDTLQDMIKHSATLTQISPLNERKFAKGDISR